MGCGRGSKDTRLLQAALYGDVAAARAALHAGASLRCRDVTRGKPYFVRRSLATLCGHLLAHGTCQMDGDTPLHLAARHGHAGVLRLLLERGAEKELTSYEFETPLHDAARQGHLECVRALLECGASINALDWHGKTPLDLSKDAATRASMCSLAAGVSVAASSAAAQGAAAKQAAARSAAAKQHAAVVRAATVANARTSAKAAAEQRVADAQRAAKEAEALAAAAERAQAATMRTHAASVPADLAALLEAVSLSAYGPALHITLGVSSAAAAVHVTDADLIGLGMKPVERRVFLTEVARARAGAGAAARPARAADAPAAAAGACDVLISYRVPETGEAGDNSVFFLQAALQERGYSVFVGEAAIQGASSWPSTIQQGVEDCKVFVVLCSPTYGDPVESPWTKRELEMADNLKKPLIPVWHSGAYPPPAVQIFFHGVQRIPGGNLRGGYIGSHVNHATVVEELAAAIDRAGVQPSLR